MAKNDFNIRNNQESYNEMINIIQAAYKIITDYNAMTPGAPIWNYSKDKRDNIYNNTVFYLQDIEKSINNLNDFLYQYLNGN